MAENMEFPPYTVQEEEASRASDSSFQDLESSFFDSEAGSWDEKIQLEPLPQSDSNPDPSTDMSLIFDTPAPRKFLKVPVLLSSGGALVVAVTLIILFTGREASSSRPLLPSADRPGRSSPRAVNILSNDTRSPSLTLLKAKPIMDHPAEIQAAEARPLKAQPLEAETREAQAAEPQPLEAKPLEAKPFEAPRTESHPTLARGSQAKTPEEFLDEQEPEKRRPHPKMARPTVLPGRHQPPRLRDRTGVAKKRMLEKRTSPLLANRRRRIRKSIAPRRRHRASRFSFSTLLGKARKQIKRGRFKRAIALLRQARRLRPRDARLHRNLGNAFFEIRNNRQALRHLRRAKALSPNSPKTYLLLASVYQDLKRVADARSSYSTYLRLAPAGRFARQVRQIMKRL